MLVHILIWFFYYILVHMFFNFHNKYNRYVPIFSLSIITYIHFIDRLFSSMYLYKRQEEKKKQNEIKTKNEKTAILNEK